MISLTLFDSMGTSEKLGARAFDLRPRHPCRGWVEDWSDDPCVRFLRREYDGPAQRDTLRKPNGESFPTLKSLLDWLRCRLSPGTNRCQGPALHAHEKRARSFQTPAWKRESSGNRLSALPQRSNVSP